MQKVMMSGVRKVRRSCIEVFSVKIREHFMNYAVQICMSWMDLSYAILQNEECQLMWSMQFKSSRNPVFGHSGVPEVWVRGSSGVRKIRKLSGFEFRFQEIGRPGVQDIWSSEVRQFEKVGSFGVQEFRDFRCWDFIMTAILEFGNSGIQECESSGV